MYMPLEIKTDTNSFEKLIHSIEKVVILKGKISNDPAIWEIHISGKVLKVDSEKIETQRAFRNQYLKVFNAPAPLVTSENWLKIVAGMSEIAEVVTAGEESERVYIANRVFEKVCELKVTDDRGLAAAGKCMLNHQGYLCVISKKIEEIVQTAGYKIAFIPLSESMTELGLKKEGTESVWYGKTIRSWWFIQSKVLTQQKVMD